MIDETTKKILEDYKEETKRHFDVVAEDLKDEIKQVAEGVSANTERIDRMHGDVSQIQDGVGVLQVKMIGVEDNIIIIKTDIEFIKHELKQKISRDEFALLEKRVNMLEARLSQKT